MTRRLASEGDAGRADLPGAPGADSTPLGEGLALALPALRRYARSLAASAPGSIDYEDVVQETLTRAWSYRHAFEAGRPLLPWLQRTLLRSFLDQLERDRRGPRAAASGEQVGGEGEPIEGRGSALDSVDARDELELCLARLSEVEREVLVRFHGDGESVRAIGAALGLPEGTVKSHLHRARRRLAHGGQR